MSGMTTRERERLRALREDVALPLRAERTQYVYELVDANGEYIGAIETEHSDDDEWCDEVHAALIVDAVNALEPLLDDLDAVDARIAKAERERDEIKRRVRIALSRMGVADCDDVCDALDGAVDEMERREREAVDEANELRRERDEARARCRHAAQALIGEMGADGPLDVDEVAERAATVLRQLREEVERLRAIDREHCERLPRVRAAAREACAALCEDAAGAEVSMGDAERAEGDDVHADVRMTRASALRQMARVFRAREE